MKTPTLRYPARFDSASRYALFGSLLISAAASQAEGIRNPPPGAFNLGRAGGRYAHVDDSSAVAHNPANLVDLKEREIQFSPSILYFGVDYESPTGAETHTVEPWKFLPNLFAAMPLRDDKLAVGFGLTVPYGLSTEWDTSLSSPLRYSAAHFAELITINFNPSVAYRFNEYISAGIGVDVMWSQLRFKQYLSPLFPLVEGKAKGDGFGYGANIGVTINLTERQRVALTYRSPMSIDYEGDFDVPSSPFGDISTSFESEIDFPTIISAGYGIQITETIRVEANVEWLQFSRFENLPFNLGPNPLVPSQNVPMDWDDTFTAGIGGDWRFAPNWVLRAGYQFYESPVPDRTFNPSIPDANQNVITMGLAYTYNRHGLEFAYGADFYDRRDISNNVNPGVNGRYENTVHLFSLAYRFRW